jgi:hypothetical protein
MLSALLLGTGVLLGSLPCYGAAAIFSVRLLVSWFRAGLTGLGIWNNVAVLFFVALFTAAAHLTQITLWAAVYLWIDECPSFARAFYCSAQNYTALGYGDVLLSERWQLLGPLEAVNGLLLFGVSTAFLFAVLSRQIRNRLHAEFGSLGEPTGDLPLTGAAFLHAERVGNGRQGHP